MLISLKMSVAATKGGGKDFQRGASGAISLVIFSAIVRIEIVPHLQPNDLQSHMATLGLKAEKKDQTTGIIETDQPVTYASRPCAIKQAQVERPDPNCMRLGDKNRPLHLAKHPNAAPGPQLEIIAVRMALAQETTQIGNSAQPLEKEKAQNRERHPDYPGVNNDFADPYLASESTPEGRDTLRRAGYFPAPSGSKEAEIEAEIERTLRLLASRDLTPAEIPGRFIRSCTPEEQQYLCRNLNAINAHASAAVHIQKYGSFERANNIAVNTTTPIGTFGVGPIMENMCDLAIGVQDTDRTSSTHGPVIGDRRPLILMNNEGGTLQVAAITSFGGADGIGRRAPPRDKEKEYALLVDELASDPKPSPGVRILGCSEAMLKPQGSWVRLSRFHELPEWAPIEWSSGRISIDAHAVLADAFNFGSGHILREIGESRKIRQKIELRKVGGDTAQREERGKKQKRDMKEIIEREERLKAQKDGSREQSEHSGIVDTPTTSSSKINESKTHQQRWLYSRNQEQQHVPIPPESSGDSKSLE
ncbi:hypothetical protein KC349_g7221 [Hortaea werneckii]|nr:hypothetical protein KC349_g7221 [Hortaea werneckii]